MTDLKQHFLRGRPDQASSNGVIDLHPGDHWRIGIDALVPPAVADEMMRAAAELELTGFHVWQPSQGGPTSLQAEVPPNTLAAILPPAERAGDRDHPHRLGV
jgi:hypothetical protein